MISYIREREYAIKLYYCYKDKYSKVHYSRNRDESLSSITVCKWLIL